MLSEQSTNSVVEVTLNLGKSLSTLTYLRPNGMNQSELLLGRRVQVEVGKRRATGVVTREQGVAIPPGITLKQIKFASDPEPILTLSQLKLAQFISDYYAAPFSECVKLCLPRLNAPADAKTLYVTADFRAFLKLEHGYKSKSDQIRRSKLQNLGFDDAAINDLLRRESLSTSPHNLVMPAQAGIHSSLDPSLRWDDKKPPSVVTLTDEQTQAVRAILDGSTKAFLLEGVTGSGKTEVYLSVAKTVLDRGQSVLFIVPEIALTPQLFERVYAGLGQEPALLHSHIASAARDASLDRIRRGEARVIIGARSALFCPAQNLGLIVVDEEHDAGYKQSESPRYHARDVALWRAHQEGAKIILGSATPSLESLHNIEKGLLKHVRLRKRASGTAVLPQVDIIDLRERRAHALARFKDKSASDGTGMCILAAPLREAIEETLARKQQVILFLNRRGYASHLFCEDCGSILKCPDCSIALTYHKKNNLLRCHQCSYIEAFKTQCPSCPSGKLIPLGIGTERVERELQLSFPEASVARFDKESIKTTKSLEKTLDKFRAGETNILIGTQMIAKGHDFPNVTLVGVVLADMGLSMPDFRASERAFQLLTQVAGRAGRGELKGRVMIQTFNPEHPAILFAKNHDVTGFSLAELAERKQLSYPPYSRAALLRIELLSEQEAEEVASIMKNKLEAEVSRLKLLDQIIILGPAPCPMLKLRKHFRWQLFLKCKTAFARKQILNAVRFDRDLDRNLAKKKGRLIIDVDPVNTL